MGAIYDGQLDAMPPPPGSAVENALAEPKFAPGGERALTSFMTFFLKCVLAPVCYVAMVAILVFLFAIRHALEEGVFWFVLVQYTAMALAMWFTTGSLKRVVLTPEGLKVSNYWSEAVVPFEACESLGWSRLWSYGSYRVVEIKLKASTRFGRKICFLPAAKDRSVWPSDQLLAELRKQCRMPG